MRRRRRGWSSQVSREPAAIVGCALARFKTRLLDSPAPQRRLDSALLAGSGSMRACFAVLLIALAGPALAQSTSAPTSSGTAPPASGVEPTAASPATPSGRSTTPAGQRPPKKASAPTNGAVAPTKDETLNRQAKKAREEQEKRMKARDAQM